MPRWWDEFVDLAWSAGFLAEQQRLRPEDRIPILFYSATSMPQSPAAESQDQTALRSLLAEWLQTYQPDVLLSRSSFVRSNLERLGISVPADLGFADIFLEELDGATAGVRSNCHRVGEMAVELVVGQLHQNIYGIPKIPTMTLVEGTWFDGHSLPSKPAIKTPPT
jgi:LacI family transcriptional regulator